MKTIFKKISMVFIGLAIISCSKEDILGLNAPTVDFTFILSSQNAPTSVSFNSISTNATTYFWEFGDGSISSTMNPQHTYSTGGTYNVKLTVTGTGGVKSLTKTVTIGNAISKVKITRIDVVAIPSTNGVLNWDTSTDKPDIYIKLFDETGAAGPRTSTIWNFIPSLATTYSVTFTSPITSTDLINSIIKVQVWDDDSDNNSTGLNGDDKIGEVPFTIRNYTSGTNKYPTMVSETSNGTMVTVYMAWE
jgi:PKD repeat protein